MMGGQRRTRRANEITAESAALLRAAGLKDPARSLQAWRIFRERVPEGEEDLSLRRLLPMVCRNFATLGLPRDPYLLRAYAGSLATNAGSLEALAHAIEVLNAARIPNLALKGTALLLGHYRDLGIRPMADVDLLVPENLVGAALDALEAEGWQGDKDRRWLSTPMHAGTLSRGRGSSLDLHRHATYEARYPEADQAFFASSERLEVEGKATRMMSASDQLLHTVVHGLRFSVVPSDIWIVDAATLVRGGGVDPALLFARARDLRLRVCLKQGLRLTSQVFGPEPNLEALLARSPRGGFLEWIEHWFRVRSPSGPLGALPNLWFAFQRGALRRAPLRRFGPFLTNTWGVPPGNLAGLLVRKAGRRLGRSISGGDETG
jgi:hypothetical protein